MASQDETQTINTTENQKIRFDEKIQEMKAVQAKNVKMFSDEEYLDYISKLKEMKKPDYKMTPYDFHLIKRFELLQIEKMSL